MVCVHGREILGDLALDYQAKITLPKSVANFRFEILPTSKRGPDELWAESAEKVLPEVLSGTRLGVPEKVPKNGRKCSRNGKKGQGAFFRQFFGTFSGTPSRVPDSTSGALFRHFRPAARRGPLWLVSRISKIR